MLVLRFLFDYLFCLIMFEVWFWLVVVVFLVASLFCCAVGIYLLAFYCVMFIKLRVVI